MRRKSLRKASKLRCGVATFLLVSFSADATASDNEPPSTSAVVAVTFPAKTYEHTRVRGGRIHGKILIEGQAFNFVSGGHKRGSAPFGNYTVGKLGGFRMCRRCRWIPGYPLSDAYDPLVRDSRSGLFAHPAGRVTAGCFGIRQDEWPHFVKTMQAVHEQKRKVTFALWPANDLPKDNLVLASYGKREHKYAKRHHRKRRYAHHRKYHHGRRRVTVHNQRTGRAIIIHRRHKLHRRRSAAYSGRMIKIQVASGHRITVARELAPRFSAMISDFVAAGYKPKYIGCYATGGHIENSRHYAGAACDFDQTGWGQTHKFMYKKETNKLIRKYGFRSGCDFSDCGHVDDGGYYRKPWPPLPPQMAVAH